MSRSFASASSQYLRYAGAVLSGPPFTVSAWVYPANYTAARTIFWLGVDATGNQAHVMMVSVNTGTITVRSRNTTSRNAVTSTSVTLNAWNHACGVWAATNDRRAFLNGGGKGTDTSSVTDATWTGTEIGRLGGSGAAAYMDGRIAEVSVWNADLSDAEVAALGAGASPLQIRRGSLVAYWPLFGLASPEPEYVGSGKGMTVTGATLADHAPVRSSFAIPGPWGWPGAFTAAGGAHQYTQTVAGGLTSSGLLVNQGQKIFAGGWSGSGLVVKQTAKPLDGGITPSGAILRTFGRSLAGSLTDSGAIQKQSGKILAGGLTDSGGIAKETQKILSGGITPSGAFTAFKVALVSLAGELTSSGAVAKRAARNLAGSLPSAGEIVKEIRASLSGALGFAGDVSKMTLLSLLATLTSAGTLAGVIVTIKVYPAVYDLINGTLILPGLPFIDLKTGKVYRFVEAVGGLTVEVV